jgi:AraC-like DNA-binding protein
LGEYSNQLSNDNPFAQKVAKPLFESGVRIAAIANRQHQDSGAGRRSYHLFSLLLEGVQEITINGEKRFSEPGDLRWIPAKTEFRRKTENKATWLYFQINPIKQWRDLANIGPYVRKYQYTDLLIANMRAILNAQNSGSAIDATLALESSIFLCRLLKHEINIVNRGIFNHSLIFQQLLNKIADNPELDWNVNTMASYVDLSKSHFSALLMEQYGVSPMEAVIKQRIRKAIVLLLHHDHSINEIALLVGYKSVSSFVRLFKQYTELSPGQYKKEYRKREIKDKLDFS